MCIERQIGGQQIQQYLLVGMPTPCMNHAFACTHTTPRKFTYKTLSMLRTCHSLVPDTSHTGVHQCASWPLPSHTPHTVDGLHVKAWRASRNTSMPHTCHSFVPETGPYWGASVRLLATPKSHSLMMGLSALPNTYKHQNKGRSKQNC
jgi:hypothetical protein